MRFNKALFLLGLLFSLCCLPNITCAATLDTKLSRDKIVLGESVTISFILYNSNLNSSPDFTPLENDFRIMGSDYGTAINVLNGATHTQTFWHVTLQPKKTGELLIPEINFGDVKSPARKLWVAESSVVNQNNDQENVDAFVQAELNTSSPYIQSQVLYTFKLFYRTQLQNPRIEPPQIKDSITAQVGDDKSYETMVKGERYFVFEKRFAIFPQKAGKLIIPPLHFRATQLGLNASSLSDPFSIPTSKPINLATQSFTLKVQKVPENFPGKTWLPAKNISLTEQWSADPTQWETGNPITRTITIEAQGLRADQIPDLSVDQIAGVNLYTDQPQRSNSIQNTLVVGTWQQKITYIPNQTQSLTLPAMTLNWWNTQTNAPALAQLKPISVQVHVKPNGLATSSAGNKPAVKDVDINQADNLPAQNPATELAQQPQAIANQNKPFYLSIWFWISIGLLGIQLITWWWSRRNKQAIETKLTAPTIKDNQPDMNAMPIFNHKKFAQACEQANTLLVQKLLLSWAKTEWQDPPTHLGQLREMVSDEDFKNELEKLEQALYASKMIEWRGDDLLAAYQKMRKDKKPRYKFWFRNKRKTQSYPKEPLPPLNP